VGTGPLRRLVFSLFFLSYLVFFCRVSSTSLSTSYLFSFFFLILSRLLLQGLFDVFIDGAKQLKAGAPYELRKAITAKTTQIIGKDPSTVLQPLSRTSNFDHELVTWFTN
jgi:hypothetical protein